MGAEPCGLCCLCCLALFFWCDENDKWAKKHREREEKQRLREAQQNVLDNAAAGPMAQRPPIQYDEEAVAVLNMLRPEERQTVVAQASQLLARRLAQNGSNRRRSTRLAEENSL